jgi:hypothetical protein
MTAQILGEKRSPRRRWTLLLPLIAMCTLAMLYVGGAQAIHDNPDKLIQMDRDAYTSTNPTLGAEDWDKVCPAATPAGIGGCLGGTTADASSFKIDPPAATIFTTGGSKDTLDVTGWQWKNGSVPDKDDLLHAFAARNEDLLYFGADRFALQGTATLGVWFMQGNVGPIPDGATSGTFSGSHQNGDILILADFQASGENSAVRVFEWAIPAVNGENLVLIAGTETTPSDCVNSATTPVHPSYPNAGSEFCATANLVNTNSPWAFQSKDGAANIFGPGLFFEGGVDLAALDLDEGCFSTFLAETRSSNAPGSQLKDFVTGQLEQCTSGVDTVPSVGSDAEVIPGTSVHDHATITVGGTTTFGGTMSFYLCGPTPLADASYTLCTSGGTVVNGSEAGALNAPVAVTGASGTATPESSAVTINNPGRYCWRGVYSGDATKGVPGSSDSTVDECFRVAKINTQTVTTPVDGSGAATSTIVLGGSIYDKAVVTGNSAGGDPTGDVNFFICKVASPGLCDGTTNVGTAVTGNPKTLASDGDAATFTSSATSGAVTPATVGRYCFRAEYGGSTVYNGSADSAATECFTVTDTTSIGSQQDWLPNDTATVSSGGGSTPISGTLSFTLYSGGTCAGTILKAAESFTLTGATTAADRTKATTNASVKVSATATVSWLVEFTPAAGSSLSASSHCESTSLTITN